MSRSQGRELQSRAEARAASRSRRTTNLGCARMQSQGLYTAHSLSGCALWAESGLRVKHTRLASGMLSPLACFSFALAEGCSRVVLCSLLSDSTSRS